MPPALAIGIAALLFAAVYAARAVTDDARDATALLYALPVVVLALRFGLRGGLAAAALAGLLTVFDANPDLDLPAVGYATRLLTLFALGGLVGWFVEREAEADRRREQAQAQVTRFFDISSDMLCTANADGYFVDLNPAWEATLGYSEEELRSRPFVDFVHPADRGRTEVEASRIFEKSRPKAHFENRYIAKDGSVRWLNWSSRLSSDGLIYARAADVTDRRRAETERQRLADELRRSNEELRQFAHLASHDLSEPLRTIAGFVQLLEKRYGDVIDEQGRDYIARAVAGADRMQTMISDLLAFSRVGQAELSSELVDLGELLDDVLAGLTHSIESRGAKVAVVDRMPTVLGDPTQLRQLLQNLISNAVKYNDSEPPRVEIGALRDGTRWRVFVADNGIGIDPAQRPRVFAPFHRLHSRDEYEGTGIGLAIAQKIVERHGGEIRVEDGLDGRGSMFSFTLGAH